MVTPYYEHAGITIYHGDCREVLAQLGAGSVDLVFTSPPYNLGTGGANFHDGGLWRNPALASGYGTHDDAMPWEEYVTWQKDVLTHCWRTVGPAGAVFYNHKPRPQAKALVTPLCLNPGLPLRQIVIWDRGSGMNFAPSHYRPACEWILIFAKPAWQLTSRGASGVGDVWRVNCETGSDHPAPFPVQLPALAIETTGAAAVLDPFMGSGTTLRAAKDLGRRAIGIEIEERYCEIAATRLGQEVMDFGEAA